jgi:hypothetical protein
LRRRQIAPLGFRTNLYQLMVNQIDI